MNKIINVMYEKFRIMLNSISPRLCTEFLYKKRFGKKIHWDNPKTINEKLQYLKLYKYSDNEIITKCVDKVLVKDYIRIEKNNICKTAKTIAVYNNVEEIKWNELPNRFVVKCNHGCGYNIICKNKDEMDLNECNKKLRKWLKTDYWKLYSETQYKNVEKKILIEELLETDDEDLLTYGIWCFNGIPKMLYIQSLGDPSGLEYIDYYDSEWNWLDITSGIHKHNPIKAKKPNKLLNMLDISKELSKDFPFVRVDFYYINDEIYLSELTFVPGGGYFKLKPESCLKEWGKWLIIP